MIFLYYVISTLHLIWMKIHRAVGPWCAQILCHVLYICAMNQLIVHSKSLFWCINEHLYTNTRVIINVKFTLVQNNTKIKADWFILSICFCTGWWTQARPKSSSKEISHLLLWHAWNVRRPLIFLNTKHTLKRRVGHYACMGH